MREALRGLTIRGRAFLFAGITAVVCGVLLGQTALGRVGALLTVLPLATAFAVGRSKYRLALGRTITPSIVSAGTPARVGLTISNEGRTPSGVLLLEDHVPYVLGTRPRFVVEGIGHGWNRTVEYQVRSDVRGRYVVGPMTVRVSDPFGLVEFGRAFHTTATLVVTPRVVELSPAPLSGGWSGSGDHRSRAFAVGSAEDVTVRDYRRGDDLRRVHWRSSARTGELMVRREEQPWEAHATLFLDNRRSAHRGEGVANSFEAAVSALASVASHLTERGFGVTLTTADGAVALGREAGGHEFGAGVAGTQANRMMLEVLAEVELSTATSLDRHWGSDPDAAGGGGAGGLVIAVLGRVSPDDEAAMRRIGHQASGAVALVLDTDAWAGVRPPGPGGDVGDGGDASNGGDGAFERVERSRPVRAEPLAGLAGLAASGWSVADLAPQDRLDDVWRSVTHAATGASSRRGLGVLGDSGDAGDAGDPVGAGLGSASALRSSPGGPPNHPGPLSDPSHPRAQKEAGR